MRFVAVSLASLASLAACSSSSVANNPFQGHWSCNVDDVLTFTTPANSLPQDNKSTTNLSIVASASGNITSTAATDSGTSCPLQLTTSGSSATLVSGQKCISGGFSLAYSQGTATANGNTFTASISYSFTGTIAVAADGGTSAEAVGGTGVSTYQCTKTGS